MQIDNAKSIDVVMLMYNLIEYSDSYLKRSGSLWQYYEMNQLQIKMIALINFPNDDYNSTVSKFKQKITGHTYSGRTKLNIRVILPLNIRVIFEIF